MELIEAGSLAAPGTSAHLLLPQPASDIGDGTPPAPPKAPAGDQKGPSPDVLWKQALDALEAAIAAAKEEPEAAKQLYKFARYGCRSEESLRGLRETFAGLRIPLDFLSPTDDHRPFA